MRIPRKEFHFTHAYLQTATHMWGIRAYLAVGHGGSPDIRRSAMRRHKRRRNNKQNQGTVVLAYTTSFCLRPPTGYKVISLLAVASQQANIDEQLSSQLQLFLAGKASNDSIAEQSSVGLLETHGETSHHVVCGPLFRSSCCLKRLFQSKLFVEVLLDVFGLPSRYAHLLNSLSIRILHIQIWRRTLGVRYFQILEATRVLLDEFLQCWVVSDASATHIENSVGKVRGIAALGSATPLALANQRVLAVHKLSQLGAGRA